MTAALLAAALISILPPSEQAIVDRVAAAYNLNREQTALLAAIRRAENGRPCLAFGVNDQRARIDDGRAFERQAQWASGTIRKRYNGDLAAFARRYSPKNWRVWMANVRRFLALQGVAK